MSKALLKICLLVLGVVLGGGLTLVYSEQSIAQHHAPYQSGFSFSGQSMIHLESPLRFVGDETHSPDLGVS